MVNSTLVVIQLWRLTLDLYTIYCSSSPVLFGIQRYSSRPQFLWVLCDCEQNTFSSKYLHSVDCIATVAYLQCCLRDVFSYSGLFMRYLCLWTYWNFTLFRSLGLHFLWKAGVLRLPITMVFWGAATSEKICKSFWSMCYWSSLELEPLCFPISHIPQTAETPYFSDSLFLVGILTLLQSSYSLNLCLQKWKWDNLFNIVLSIALLYPDSQVSQEHLSSDVVQQSYKETWVYVLFGTYLISLWKVLYSWPLSTDVKVETCLQYLVLSSCCS